MKAAEGNGDEAEDIVITHQFLKFALAPVPQTLLDEADGLDLTKEMLIRRAWMRGLGKEDPLDIKMTIDLIKARKAELEVMRLEIQKQMFGKVTKTGKQVSSKGRVIGPERWGITPSQIRLFCNEVVFRPVSEQNAMTIRKYVRSHVTPVYRSGRSIALTYNDKRPMDVCRFVSHSWDSLLEEFFRDLLLVAGDDDTRGFYICWMSNYQGTRDEVRIQVTQGQQDVAEGCIAIVLNQLVKVSGYMLSMPNDHMMQHGLFQRLWCCWEVYSASVLGIPIRSHPWHCSEQHFFGETGASAFNAQHSECGDMHSTDIADKDDQKALRRAISSIGWQSFNYTVVLNTTCNPDLETRCELGSLHIGDNGARIMAANLQWPVLDLYCNDLTGHGAQHLALGMAETSTLKELLLWENKVGDAGVQALMGALEAGTTCDLEVLNLRNNRISSLGAEIFATRFNSKNCALRYVNLSHNLIGNSGARALGKAMTANTMPSQIDLGDNRITDVGGRALAQGLALNSTISELGLSGNNLGDKVIVDIGKALQANKDLESLYVNRCQITDDGASKFFETIKENKFLKHLHISDNKISTITFAAVLASKNSQLSVSGQAEMGSCNIQ